MTPKDLIAWRNKHGLTQIELGKLLNVTKTCVYRWEAGYRKIPPFLQLALEGLEMKGGIMAKGKKKPLKKGGRHGKRNL